MKRRAVILMSSAAVLCLSFAARAITKERPRISILHSGFPNRTPIHHLFAALSELGYENDRTADIELLGGEGDADRLKELVAHLATQRPDLIIAITSPAVLAIKQAGLTTPVVFAFVSDPVALGIIESLARPGGNFTGVTYSEAELGGKRLELLADALPNIKRVSVLWSSSFRENAAMLESVRRSASALGIDLYSRKVTGVEDLARAFDDAKKADAQAVVFMTDNALFGHRKEVADLALAYHLPTIHSFPPEVEDGGLMSFGPSQEDSYRRAAALADKILKGARPADLPVEEPTRFSLSINLKTAKSLGISLPPSIMIRADEVIE
jgi:putative tryptophan/tyrosine transport system substrate-binding protein